MSKLEFNIAAARAETDLGTCGAMLDNACNEIERLRGILAHELAVSTRSNHHDVTHRLDLPTGIRNAAKLAPG